MAVEHDTRVSNGPKERNTCGQLVNEIHIIRRCTWPKEMCGRVQLSCVCKENVKLPSQRTRERWNDVMHMQSTQRDFRQTNNKEKDSKTDRPQFLRNSVLDRGVTCICPHSVLNPANLWQRRRQGAQRRLPHKLSGYIIKEDRCKAPMPRSGWMKATRSRRWDAGMVIDCSLPSHHGIYYT